MLKQFITIKARNCLNLVFLSLIMIATIVFSISSANSQTSSSLSVYTKQGKVFVADILTNNSYQLVRDEGQWSLIKFDKATVPVWVSDDYITVDQGFATVTAKSALNARMRPSLQSRILFRLPNGYTSPVIATLAGFVNIYAPADLVVAIESETSRTKTSDNSDRVIAEQSNINTTASVNSWSTRPTTVVSQVTTDDTVNDVDKNLSLGPRSNNSIQKSSQNQTDSLKGVAQTKSSTPLKAISNSAKLAFTQTQRVEPQTSLFNTTTDRLHKIAPGDAISVFVFGEQDLSASGLLVPESGTVSLPLIGNIDVQGKTVSEIETIIAQRLSQGYVKNPKLSVTISSYRAIFIRGAVNQTGSFSYSAGLTIAKAIALAGGTKSFARIDGVSILRDGVYVEEGLYLDSQYQIKPGDVVTITEEDGFGGKEDAFIYLHGEVNNAGEYVYRKGLTVEKAIVLAGGFSLRASQKKITVTRYEEGKDEPIKLKRVKLYLPIKAGDVIKVGARLF